MHFQTVFGLDALHRISAKEFKRWQVYFRTYGPIHWRRQDWNFAKLADHFVGTRETRPKNFLLGFEYVTLDPANEPGTVQQIQTIVGAFGGLLPAEDIAELEEAALIYG